MSAKNKKAATRNASPAATAAGPELTPAVTTAVAPPFPQRHPKISQAIFVGVCIYVAMLWLLVLDQTFHWGIFDPKIPVLP